MLAGLLALSAAAAAPHDMSHMEATDRFRTMIHGYAFFTVNDQGGPSGDRRVFESQNHLMVQSQRRWLGGKLQLLGTFTLEPLTIRPEGSPLLFQRGETFEGELLVDRQHPHDLFLELAARWERGRFALYAAPLGEPAVGPTAYTHRASAAANPLAPLAHHNQDSTHLTADVVTLGFHAGPISLEASGFHGEEPDENRFDIDQGPIDSYSGRITGRPLAGLTLQISAARREHPEALEDGDQTRQTASAEYAREIGGGSLAATLIFGRNLLPAGQVERGDTLEVAWSFARRHTLFTRLERVDRDVYELLNKQQRPEDVAAESTRIEAATLGYLRDLPFFSEAPAAVGATLTAYRYDDRLDAVYGSSPISITGFLRLTFMKHLP